MQHFNVAMDINMRHIEEQLSHAGYTTKDKNWILHYVDDILVGLMFPKDHLPLLRIVFQGLEHSGWTLNIQKGSWFQKKVDFLRVRISKDGLSQDLS